jgi:YidC/Oxa1 family membrane protein insertase
MPKEPVRENARATRHPAPLPKNVGTATNNPAPQGVQTMLIYTGQTLGGSAVLERQITIFAGLKNNWTLVQIGEQLNNHADQVMNFGSGSFATSGRGHAFRRCCCRAWAWATRLDETWLRRLARSSLITVLNQGAFLAAHASAARVSMKRMQALAPEVDALKEKFKDGTCRSSRRRRWELYKEHKVNPMSGCLPMFIQMPVFIGFFTMIRSAIELRGAHFLWAADLVASRTRCS